MKKSGIVLSKTFNDAEVKQFRRLLEGAKNIVCTAHVRPDGDAIGSLLGLYHMLSAIGKQPVCITPDQPPRSLAFMPGFKKVVAYSKYPEYVERVMHEADLILCCDFNKISRQDELGAVTGVAGATKVLIDHHLSPDDFADMTFSYPEMSSTCELIFRLLAAMGYYEEMPKDAATCLCTGLITDTRNFSVNCNNPEVYKILIALLEKGVDKRMIVKEAMETKSLSSVKLQAYALCNKMELLEQGKVSVLTLDKEELVSFSYEKGDTEGLVNMPLEVKGVVCSFYLREDPGCIKVSARSVNSFPVNKVCEDLFGGGGHLQAAGGEYIGTLEDCRKLLVDNIASYFKK